MKLVCKASCHALACTCRQLELEGDTSVVRLWHELGLDSRAYETDSTDEYHERDDHHDSPVADAPVDELSVST